VCLLLGLFGGAHDKLSALDFTWNCRQSNVTNDDDPLRLTIHNATADAYDFRHEISGAVNTSLNPTGIPDWTIAGVPSGFSLAAGAVGSSGNSITGSGAAGADTFMRFYVLANNTSGANAPAPVDVSFSGAFYFRKVGDVAWTRQTWASTKNIQFNYSGSGTGVASDTVVGVVNFTGPLETNTGLIRVSGLHGNYSAVLQLDGVTVASSDHLPADPLDASDPGPNLEFETDDPAAFVGQEITVRVNGFLCYTEVVEVDIDGNFEYLISATAWEYPQRVTDDAGTEIPLPTDDTMTEPLTDPDHVRDAPGPIPGTDPKTDTSDNLTVQDSYRATRAAIEDALRTPDSPRFNFDEWRGNDRADGDADGAAAGGGLGGGMDAVADVAGGGVSSMPIPSGGALSVMVAGTSFNIPTFEIASVVRLFLLMFLLIFVFMRAVSIARGAFTTES